MVRQAGGMAEHVPGLGPTPLRPVVRVDRKGNQRKGAKEQSRNQTARSMTNDPREAPHYVTLVTHLTDLTPLTCIRRDFHIVYVHRHILRREAKQARRPCLMRG